MAIISTAAKAAVTKLEVVFATAFQFAVLKPPDPSNGDTITSAEKS